MPLTRLFNYIAGSLAKGEDVSDEFDQIIAFINGLDTDKLDIVGGTVNSLSVTGAFTANGASDFNGTTTFSAGVTFDSGADLTLGAGSNLLVGGTLGVTGLSTLAGFNSSAAGTVNSDFSVNQGVINFVKTTPGSAFRIENTQNNINLHVGGANKIRLCDDPSNGVLELNGTNCNIKSNAVAIDNGLTLNGAFLKAANLPTVAGASGTLWVDTGAGNVVKRVP